MFRPGAYASEGTIIINGGSIKTYSQWGAAIGSGYNVVMGSMVGQEDETIASFKSNIIMIMRILPSRSMKLSAVRADEESRRRRKNCSESML